MQRDAQPHRPAWWRPTLEYGPLVVFLLVLLLAGRLGLTERGLSWFALEAGQESTARFLLATAVFVPLGLLGTALLWLTEAKKPYPLLFGTLLVLVFGGLTLYFRDPAFLQLKVTLANLLFAGMLAAGLMLRRLFLKDLMAEGLPFTVADKGWQQSTWLWIGFFVLLALLNEVLRRSLGTDAWAWVTKVGFTVATFAVSLAMIAILNAHKLSSQD